jgi:hypothetical protein
MPTSQIRLGLNLGGAQNHQCRSFSQSPEPIGSQAIDPPISAYVRLQGRAGRGVLRLRARRSRVGESWMTI